MLALLTGTVADLAADHAVITCGGVGYQVFCPTRSLGALVQGKEATLHTHLAVREDALTLYGFTEVSEKRIFNLLLTVSGVGPRMALSLLSTWSGAEVMSAIHTGQPGMLAKASGVGKKLAEKIIVELKDKKAPALSSTGGASSASTTPLWSDLVSALTNLGYPLRSAETAASETVAESPALPFADAFKQALKKVA